MYSSWARMSQQEIIANVHVEKAAGQTFIAILEKNFTYRHCRVKPYKKSQRGVFDAEAMRTVLRINPFVKAISGHSIRPYSDLEKVIPNVKYVTILREPVERYISHYQYWIEKMGKSMDFAEFIDDTSLHNFQTIKIAGVDDAEGAKRILRDKFFLVGVVEEFDDFLRLLKQKLSPMSFDISYKRKNIGNKGVKNRILSEAEKYREKIIQANDKDIELYDFVKNNLFMQEKQRCIEGNKFNNNSNHESETLTHFPIWKIFCNLYYAPIIKLLRLLHGLPPSGSY